MTIPNPTDQLRSGTTRVRRALSRTRRRGQLGATDGVRHDHYRTPGDRFSMPRFY